MSAAQELGDTVSDGYYSYQNRVAFQEFWTELTSAQDAIVALGGPFIELRNLRVTFSCSQIAVFLNIGAGPYGYVAPAGTGPFIELANAHARVPSILDELRTSYEEFDDTPLHRTMKLFASFVARAARHQADGHIDEAFLHFVIALELVFSGTRHDIQKRVCERAALMTFRCSGRSFRQQCGWIANIYDLRSRYVHAGQRLPGDVPLNDLRALCEDVFRSLLRFQGARRTLEERSAKTLDEWLRRIDHLVSGYGIGEEPDDAALALVFAA
jgi:hypothetical protein